MFSQEYVNSGRQKEFDLMRGVTIFFMVFHHAQGEMFGFEQGTAANIILNLRSNLLGTAAFMTIMGVAFKLHKAQSTARFPEKGLDITSYGFFTDRTS